MFNFVFIYSLEYYFSEILKSYQNYYAIKKWCLLQDKSFKIYISQIRILCFRNFIKVAKKTDFLKQKKSHFKVYIFLFHKF